jgi:hypothetical protein
MIDGSEGHPKYEMQKAGGAQGITQSLKVGYQKSCTFHVNIDREYAKSWRALVVWLILRMPE